MCLVAYSSVTFGYTDENAVYTFSDDSGVKEIGAADTADIRTFQSESITATDSTNNHVITLSISGGLEYVIDGDTADNNTIALKGTKTAANVDGADVKVKSYGVTSMTISITVDPKGTGDNDDGNTKTGTLSATLAYDSTTTLSAACDSNASATLEAEELKDGEDGLGVYVAISSEGKLLICE